MCYCCCIRYYCSTSVPQYQQSKARGYFVSSALVAMLSSTCWRRYHSSRASVPTTVVTASLRRRRCEVSRATARILWSPNPAALRASATTAYERCSWTSAAVTRPLAGGERRYYSVSADYGQQQQQQQRQADHAPTRVGGGNPSGMTNKDQGNSCLQQGGVESWQSNRYIDYVCSTASMRLHALPVVGRKCAS